MWLPEAMLFSQVEPNLVHTPGGERLIYDAGELLGIKFSNYTPSFGLLRLYPFHTYLSHETAGVSASCDDAS